MRYYISGKYENAEGIDVNNNVWRYSARSNLGFTPSAAWDIDASFGYTQASIGLANDIGVRNIKRRPDLCISKAYPAVATTA